jgi:hypothetical protein
MSNTIESIWQNGFVQNINDLAPKINDLYNQKSQNLVDKFEDMFAANQTAVLIGAATLFAVLSFFGMPFLGLTIALMLCGLVTFGQRQLSQLRLISKEVSSFEYLKSFDLWLDNSINQYVTIYRYFYPALFSVCAVRFTYSDLGISAAEKFELTALIFGIPAIFLIMIILAAGILGVIGGSIYRADVNLVYGREMAKLKELIADMEILRKED